VIQAQHPPLWNHQETGEKIINPYNWNNYYKNYHPDIANDKGIYGVAALVNLSISAKFGKITNSGLQFQLHIKKYLTMQD